MGHQLHPGEVPSGLTLVAVEDCLVEEVNLVVGEDLEAVTGLILVKVEEAFRMVDWWH